jgi:hypothetical protein
MPDVPVAPAPGDCPIDPMQQPPPMPPEELPDIPPIPPDEFPDIPLDPDMELLDWPPMEPISLSSIIAIRTDGDAARTDVTNTCEDSKLASATATARYFIVGADIGRIRRSRYISGSPVALTILPDLGKTRLI